MRNFKFDGNAMRLNVYVASASQTTQPTLLRHQLLLAIFVSVFICFSGAAQAQSRQDVGTAEAVKPLQIGDTIPEELWNMPLQVVNHPEGKDTITLNDYRDKKLIILDFWATWCGSCITSLKKLDVIQRNLTADFVVIPISRESSKIVFKFIANKEWKLPSVYQDTILRSFFPHVSLPHHIWINENKVKAISSALYTTKENIHAAVEGAFPNIPTKNEYIAFDHQRPLMTGVESDISDEIRHYSTITGRLNVNGGVYFLDNGIKAINQTILDLYAIAYSNIIPSSFRRTRTIVEVPDSLIDKIGANFSSLTLNQNVAQYDDWKRDNTYCYDLFVKGVHDRTWLNEFMIQDLNRYFSASLGVWGHIETRLVPCTIVTIRDEKLFERIKAHGENAQYESYDKHTSLRNITLNDLADFIAHSIRGYTMPIIAEEISNIRISLKFPKELNNMDAVEKELANYGLALSQEDRQFPMLVISMYEDVR